MSGRLGIDFGTSNSVAAVHDEDLGSRTIAPLEISEQKTVGDHETTVVPSLVHYDPDRADVVWYGAQVRDRNLQSAPTTFRWMKRYIADRTPAPRRVGSRMISPRDAGKEFVVNLVDNCMADLGITPDEEVAFSVPVESFEHYDTWLRDVCDERGLRRFRLIDEASAAALGYGAHIQPGDIYLVFDFGGGTLDVSVVKIERDDAAAGGRRCRPLGKKGADIGGSSIDSWLFRHVLSSCGLRDGDESVRTVSAELLLACEAAKERLSSQTAAPISVIDPKTGARVLDLDITRDALEDLLDEHDMFTRIDSTVDRALELAQERGYGRDMIKKVLLVGGSTLVPSVKRHVVRRFGKDAVLSDRPLEAVALGAAAFVSGVDFYDHIQHDYAVRYVDPTTGEYGFEQIVAAGTEYPTEEPVVRTVKAAWDDQRELGIAIYELSEPPVSSSKPLELVFDTAGAPRTIELTIDERRERTNFWMNEGNQTFLTADPPARKGQARFSVQFHVDENKRLLITARDLVTDRWVFDRHPVVKLT